MNSIDSKLKNDARAFQVPPDETIHSRIMNQLPSRSATKVRPNNKSFILATALVITLMFITSVLFQNTKQIEQDKIPIIASKESLDIDFSAMINNIDDLATEELEQEYQYIVGDIQNIFLK